MERIAAGMYIFARLTGLMLAMPVFGASGVPPWARLGVSFPLTLLLLPVSDGAMVPETLSGLLGTLALESVVGLLTGFCVSLVHASLVTAAEILGIQAGLSLSAVLDPVSGVQSGVLGSFALWLGTGVFLGAGIPRFVLSAVAGSFDALPPGAVRSLEGIGALVPLAGGMFATAVQLAGPLTLFVLVVNLTLNLLGRMTQVQQLFFAVGTTLQTSLALVLMGATLPVLLRTWLGSFSDVLPAIEAVLSLAGG